MKKFLLSPILLSLLFLLISIAIVGKVNITNTNSNTTIDQITSEVKGIWVSYITLDMQTTDKSKESFYDKINEIIKTTKESGFNTLIFQVRPFSDALYNSNYYPWSHILTGEQGKNPGYDPLEIICSLCHKNDIQVHAWINPYRVKSVETPDTLSVNNPYIKDNSIGFEHNGNIYLDPSNEKAQELIVNSIEEIINNYDIDGVHFDDYFYPENCDGFDEEKYNEYKASVENPKSKVTWRMENVNNLVKNVYDTIHKNSDNIVFGISPQGNLHNNHALGADVKTWCTQKGYIDYIAPQIYFSLDNPELSFEECLVSWLNLNLHDNLKLYIGLAGYKAGSDEDSGTWLDNNDILQNEIEISKEKGADGIILYSYESIIDKQNEPEIKNVINYMTGVKQ